jgi:hypothetical protein
MKDPSMSTWIAVLLAWLPFAALAWGPGSHLEFEHRVFRRRRERLPASVANLIEEHRAAWQYGHIAADIINFKAVGGPYSHCHRWSIVTEMRALSHRDSQRAFALGYLAHLAADTIAHNHFVPYHLARFARTKSLGHLYWELNADRFVPEERWSVVTRLKRDRELDFLDDLVHRTVPRKALSMTTNKLIFNHVLLVSERDAWRRAVDHLHPMEDLDLDHGFLDRFRDAAVERIELALSPGGFEALSRLDANGKTAQSRAMRARRSLLHRWIPRRMRVEHSLAISAPFLDGMESPPRAEAQAPAARHAG